MIVIVLGRKQSARLKLNVENPPALNANPQRPTSARLWLTAIITLATFGVALVRIVSG